MTVLYANFQLGHKELLLCCLRRVPSYFWLECLRVTKAHKEETKIVRLFSTQNQIYCSGYICIGLLHEFFSFHFGFLLPSAFMFSYKRVQSVNSNYPPFLSLNQSFGDHTCFPKPSKQLWLWCWPRFTIVLKQYAVLCLGFFFFLGMVYECTHSSVIVYSPKSACYNVLWQPVWVCWTLRRVIKCDVRLVWLMIIALLSQFCLDPISIGWYLHEFLESEFRDRWYSRLLEDISAQHNEFGWIHRTGSFCEHVK